jgi:uncharacterized membrane protein
VSTDVTVENVVVRPREEVARYASDWRNDPLWIGGVTEARQVTEGAFGVGTQVLRVASFLGRRIEYVTEVVEHDPGAGLAMRAVRGPFPLDVAYEFEDAGGGETRMRIRARGDASGFYRLAGPLLSRAVKRSIAGDVERLKRLLESGSP